jgi:RNA polymerase sigma-70 factor (ECF subfamily)
MEEQVSEQQNKTITNPKYPNDSGQTMWLTMTKNGDRPAFNHIVKKYRQPIYNYCYRMLQNRNEAEDAAQEVFLRAYARLDTYDDRHKFSTWLFSIASHYCIDRLRKRRFQLVSWDDLAPWHLFPGQDARQPEKALLKAEADREVRILLDALPSDCRTVIILKYWRALSYQEIAQTLETTVSAVKSKLFRARKMMTVQATSAQAPALQQDTAIASSRMVFNSPLKMARLEVI